MPKKTKKPLVLLLTRRELIAELEGEIKIYTDSYRERDGKVRDAGALRTIAALRQATLIIKLHGKAVKS